MSLWKNSAWVRIYVQRLQHGLRSTALPHADVSWGLLQGQQVLKAEVPRFSHVQWRFSLYSLDENPVWQLGALLLAVSPLHSSGSI